jgi:oxaloacetate decarboxylase (Na+ extruding) subunit alpha
VNIKEIKEMVNLMNENSLVELEIEKEGMRVRLKKTSPGFEGGNSPIVIEKHSIPVEQKTQSSSNTPAVEKNSAKRLEIKAPMVGTFYRAPAPEAPPYAEVGQIIEIGQVVCIIEAMKLMNEIKAEIKGKIVEIAVDNAEPVEYGQPMFIIEPI